MIKQTLALVGLSFSIATNAAISHNGYTLNESTNIVSGGGLEWLQWDETVRQSIDTALATYGHDGWRVASNVEMAELFSAFFPQLAWDTDEQTVQQLGLHDTLGSMDSPANMFITLFGDTYAAGGFQCCGTGDNLQKARAFFGADTDGDSLFNQAVVFDEYTSWDAKLHDGSADLYGDGHKASLYGVENGVALVRISEVPIPAAGWLFISALVGLVGIKRRSRR